MTTKWFSNSKQVNVFFFPLNKLSVWQYWGWGNPTIFQKESLVDKDAGMITILKNPPCTYCDGKLFYLQEHNFFEKTNANLSNGGAFASSHPQPILVAVLLDTAGNGLEQERTENFLVKWLFWKRIFSSTKTEGQQRKH